MENRPPAVRAGRLRSVIFTVAAFSLPLLVLLGVEGAVRLAGVGSTDQNVFAAIPGHPEYLGTNPAYPRRYFNGFTPSVAPDVFLKQKEAGSLRIFVLGGSSTAGYPYMSTSAFPAQLQRKLDRHFHDRRVEVVNLGMTAVNSFTLWDLKNALLDQSPDAVLVYAGHNEYYGAFGAGGTVNRLGNQVWLKRLVLTLKDFVLYRLLEGALWSVRVEAGETASLTMMAQLAGEQEIDLGGAVYRAGLAQFEANLGDVVASITASGVPVFLSTVASNLRDQPPLGRDSTARAHFSQAGELLASGQVDDARSMYEKARDHDPIRFRAPSEINRLIAETAQRHNARLVDTRTRVQELSRHRIEGRDLFMDHLHPSSRGYAILAEAFFDALVEHFETESRPLAQLDDQDLRLDAIDSISADINIERLFGGFPFTASQTPAQASEVLRTLVDSRLNRSSVADSLAMLMLLSRLAPPEALRRQLEYTLAAADTAGSLLLYRSLLALQPFDPAILEAAARLGAESVRHDGVLSEIAITGLKRTGDLRYQNLLAAIAIRRQDFEEARYLLVRLEERVPSDATMLYNQARLHILTGDTARAQEYFRRFQASR